MRRALHIGLFIGTLIGVSACGMSQAARDGGGFYGGAEAGRTR